MSNGNGGLCKEKKSKQFFLFYSVLVSYSNENSSEPSPPSTKSNHIITKIIIYNIND